MPCRWKKKRWLSWNIVYYIIMYTHVHSRENCSISLSWASLDYSTIKEQHVARTNTHVRKIRVHTHLHVGGHTFGSVRAFFRVAAYRQEFLRGIRTLFSSVETYITQGNNGDRSLARSPTCMHVCVVCGYKHIHCFIRPDWQSYCLSSSSALTKLATTKFDVSRLRVRLTWWAEYHTDCCVINRRI